MILTGQAVACAVEGQVLRAALFAGAALGTRFANQWVDQIVLNTATARARARYRSRLLDFVTGPAARETGLMVAVSDDIEAAAQSDAVDLWGTSAYYCYLNFGAVAFGASAAAVWTVVALMALCAPAYVYAGRRARVADHEYRVRRAHLEEAQLDALRGALELRGLGAVAGGTARVRALSERAFDVADRAMRTALGSSLVTEFLGGVSVGLTAMISGFALLHGETTVMRAVVSVLAAAEVAGHIRRYGSEYHRREAVIEARQRLDAIYGARVPVGNLGAEQLVTAAHPSPITFSVSPGERLRVRGPSGVGKTTLLATVLGWVPPVSGTVSAPSRVGYVSPESSLLSSDLRTSLTLGTAVTDDEVRATLRELGLDDQRFADLDAPVDQRSCSDGERVRLVLARALLTKAPALVLDDVAGVLDDEARHRVTDVLARTTNLALVECTSDLSLLGDATELVIA